MALITMTEQHRISLAQLQEEYSIRRQIIGDLGQTKLEDIPKIVDRLKLEDFPLWPQFMKAILRPLKRTMAELTGYSEQGYYLAKSICWVVSKAIKGEMDSVSSFLLQIDPMDKTTEQERAATAHLKQIYDPAWYQIIEVLTPPLYRKLHQVIGSDNEKIVDYTNEVLTLVMQAIEKVEGEEPGINQK